LNYSEAKTQTDIEKLLAELEGTDYIDPTYTESWLREFLAYLKDYYLQQEDAQSVDDEDGFVKVLNQVSLFYVEY